MCDPEPDAAVDRCADDAPDDDDEGDDIEEDDDDDADVGVGVAATMYGTSGRLNAAANSRNVCGSPFWR